MKIQQKKKMKMCAYRENDPTRIIKSIFRHRRTRDPEIRVVSFSFFPHFLGGRLTTVITRRHNGSGDGSELLNLWVFLRKKLPRPSPDSCSFL